MLTKKLANTGDSMLSCMGVDDRSADTKAIGSAVVYLGDPGRLISETNPQDPIVPEIGKPSGAACEIVESSNRKLAGDLLRVGSMLRMTIYSHAVPKNTRTGQIGRAHV